MDDTLYADVVELIVYKDLGILYSWISNDLIFFCGTSKYYDFGTFIKFGLMYLWTYGLKVNKEKFVFFLRIKDHELLCVLEHDCWSVL